MASIAFTSHTPTRTSLGHRIARSALAPVGYVRAWFRARRTHFLLQGLSDRQLEDIGITRLENGKLSFDPARTR